MKTKILNSIWSTNNLENKVNEFIKEIEQNNCKVKEVQYSTELFYVSAMIVYQEKK